MKCFLYPKHPVRAIITGPSGCGKTYLLTHLITKIFNNFFEIYIYSPPIHQDTYQTLIECFEQKIPLKYFNKVSKEQKDY